MKFFKHKLSVPIAVAVFAALAVAVFSFAKPVWAQGFFSQFGAASITSIGDIIRIIVGSIVFIYVHFIGLLLLIIINVLTQVASYNDFVNSAVVVNGWAIVRDLSNMFFILILLYIAFATILGVSGMDWKQRLPKLLIFAILINFTRVIAGLAIDFGQVIMITFVNGFKDAAGGNFAELLGIKDMLEVSVPGGLQQAQQIATGNVGGAAIDFLQVIGGMIGAALFATVALIVIIAITLVLVYRMVMLWIYVVLSPLAFILGAFPQGESYYAQWWKQFTSAIAVGPLLAFFLWLSLLSVGSITQGISQTAIAELQGGQSAAAQVSCGASQICQPDNVLKFIIGIGLLMGGLTISQSMAASAGGGMEGIVGWAKKAAPGAMKKITGVAAIQRGYAAYKAQREEYKKGGLVTQMGTRMGAGTNVIFGLGSKRAKQQQRNVLEADLEKKKSYIDHLTNADLAKQRTTEAYAKLADRGALTREFIAEHGLDPKMMEAAFMPGLEKSKNSFKKSLKATSPSHAFDMSADKGREEAAVAVIKGETSLDKFDPKDLNAAFVAKIQQKASWSEERWNSEKSKLGVDAQANLLGAMAAHTQSVDLGKVSGADFAKELALKRVVAKSISLEKANLGAYSYTDPVTGLKKSGDALREYVREQGERLAITVPPDEFDKPQIAAAIQLAMPAVEYEKFLKALSPEIKAKYQSGAGKLVSDPTALGFLTNEERRRVRERSMAAGADFGTAYDQAPGRPWPSNPLAASDFRDSLKGSEASKVVLNMKVPDVSATVAFDIVDNLDPTQFVEAAKEAVRTRNKEQLDVLRKIMAEVASAPVVPGSNADKLKAKMAGPTRARIFDEI
ncbi:hypothetical protein HYT45_00820 [Candidatus Uhrbacteria bacterium]|nr:hypothetical protein [Candidatus Wildermuthbacteria bacterium]MBI2098941.1 hypothetical protein [Candidatus Uhrbacteria bacterium]